MTPDQQQRLAVAETQIDDIREDIGEMKAMLKDLVAAKNKGEGAIWLFFKAAALAAAIVAGVTWLANHVRL